MKPSVDVTSATFGDALAQLAGPLWRRAYRLTRNSHQAEDLCQETMARAWAARLSFRSGTNLQAWTYTILRNLYLTTLRRSRPSVDLNEFVSANLVEPGADQHEKAELHAVLKAVDQLPEDQRAALLAVALDGLNYEAAADKLHVSRGALRSRIWRARAALLRLVEESAPLQPHRRAKKIEPADPVVTPDVPNKGRWAAAKAAGRPLWIGC